MNEREKEREGRVSGGWKEKYTVEKDRYEEEGKGREGESVKRGTSMMEEEKREGGSLERGRNK